jgi:hypothetical protein
MRRPVILENRSSPAVSLIVQRATLNYLAAEWRELLRIYWPAVRA